MLTALIQTDIVWNDPQSNLEKLKTKIAEAATNRAELIVLPEMFNCGFSFLNGEAAESANRLGTEFLKEMAGLYRVAICGSLPEIDSSKGDRPFNTLYVALPNRELSSYRKLHLFSFGGEPEKYQAGNSLLTVNIEGVRTSFLICYDLRFPIPFEILAPETDLFVVVANWPAPRSHHWRTLLTARAIEQQAYVVGVNRIGEGGGLQYAGDSLAISPRGEILVDAKSDAGLFTAAINPDEVLSYRESFTALKDRQKSVYEALWAK